MNRNFSAIHWILVFLCLFIYSCEEDNKVEAKLPVAELPGEKESNAPSNYVVFTVTTDDKYELDGFTLLDYSNFYGGRPSELPEGFFQKAGDSVQFVLKNLQQPQVMEVFNMAETKNSTRFLVTPGDTVHLDYREGEFTFSGDNAAHYNFYANLSDDEYARNPYRGDLQQYKAETEKIYNRRRAYFDRYVQQNPEISEDFKKQVAAELKFEYLYNLVAPRVVQSKGLEGIYINDMDGISTVLNDTRMGNEQLLDLKTYFDGVTIDDFRQPQLVNNDYFKRDLVDFIKHYFAQNEVAGYTEENFRRELNFINNNLHGELKTVATGKLIREYHRKNFGRGWEDRKFFKEVIAEFKNRPLKPSYKEEILNIEEELNLMSSSLPEAMMQDQLVSLEGDTLTISQLLDRTEGKIRYLDFWATWCPPCIADFKASKNFKEGISSKEDIEFIYISVEKDFEDWREKSGLLKEYLTSGVQYKFLNVEDSKILRFLKIRDGNGRIMIPKYTVIDEKRKIISANAPRLADSMAVKKLLKIH